MTKVNDQMMDVHIRISEAFVLQVRQEVVNKISYGPWYRISDQIMDPVGNGIANRVWFHVYKGVL